jgi:hypothetical protein
MPVEPPCLNYIYVRPQRPVHLTSVINIKARHLQPCLPNPPPDPMLHALFLLSLHLSIALWHMMKFKSSTRMNRERPHEAKQMQLV